MNIKKYKLYYIIKKSLILLKIKKIKNNNKNIIIFLIMKSICVRLLV